MKKIIVPFLVSTFVTILYLTLVTIYHEPMIESGWIRSDSIKFGRSKRACALFEMGMNQTLVRVSNDNLKMIANCNATGKNGKLDYSVRISVRVKGRVKLKYQ